MHGLSTILFVVMMQSPDMEAEALVPAKSSAGLEMSTPFAVDGRGWFFFPSNTEENEEAAVVAARASAPPSVDAYPNDLLLNQILWGGLVYLVGELASGFFPPLILVVPFATGYTVSEVGISAGYPADWFLPGLAAFGGALLTGIVTWGGACGLCMASGAASSFVTRAGSPPLGSGVALAGLCGSVAFFVVGAFAQPFVASTAAAFTYRARAKRTRAPVAAAEGVARLATRSAAMAY